MTLKVLTFDDFKCRTSTDIAIKNASELDYSTLLIISNNHHADSRSTLRSIAKFSLKLQAMEKDTILFTVLQEYFPLKIQKTCPLIFRVWAGGMIDRLPISTGMPLEEAQILKSLISLPQHHLILDGGLSMKQTEIVDTEIGVINPPHQWQVSVKLAENHTFTTGDRCSILQDGSISCQSIEHQDGTRIVVVTVILLIIIYLLLRS